MKVGETLESGGYTNDTMLTVDPYHLECGLKGLEIIKWIIY